MPYAVAKSAGVPRTRSRPCCRRLRRGTGAPYACDPADGGVSLGLAMRIFIIGAGQVGSTIVEALHDEHELTVIDTDAGRLEALGSRYDVGTVEADGASRRVLEEAGLRDAELVIACTSRDEVNVIVSMFARRLAPDARTIVRTGNEEYLDVWRERQLDVDWVVSSERETALAVSQTIGVPAARQTDVFADGQVQIVEFDVEKPVAADERFERVVGPALKDAVLPADSKVASIIRGEEIAMPRGEETIRPGDRIVVIGSPEAAKEWSRLLTPDAANGRRHRHLRRRPDRHGDGPGAAPAGDPGAPDRERPAPRAGGLGAPAGGSRLPRDRHRSGVPGAGAHRRVARPPSSRCATTRRTTTRRRSRSCTASG